MLNLVTRRDFLAGASAAAVLSLAGVGTVFGDQSAAARRSFTPGEPWVDTAGKPIQAHGGSVMQVGDTFYWYGENKERTLPGSKIYTYGVRCYSSKDLYNWTDLGLIIPPELDKPGSALHPSSQLDRPHIIYNARTKKFVCWLKIMGSAAQTRTVLVADAITGPYQMLRTGMMPDGMSAGDFDLVVEPSDGKAYQYFERVHSELICADLSDDYTDVTGYYSTHFPRVGPPFVREGPAYFRRNGKHYLITSGTTGYHPNPSEIAVADSYHGPWTVLGDLHPSDRSRTSFNSQVSCVFKHPAKKDLYIALADRWLPDLPTKEGVKFETGEASKDFQGAFAKLFSGRMADLTAGEKAAIGPGPVEFNTSISTYVWLPISFEKERPLIEWRPEWKLDDFQ